jgi:pimeloyl-ACP methyl ester carboxylesterase
MKKLSHIAYNKLEGKTPTVVFLSGFKSDMGGTKALYLETVCKEIGQSFIRFDYSWHGASEGKFEDGTISQWLSDTLKIVDELTTGKIILVGSSMGGWLALLTALQRPNRIKALIGIAPAPDFTESLIWEKFSEKQKSEVLQNGKTLIPNCYDDQEAYPITRNLIEDGRKHLLLGKTIAITCPIRLIHGMQDDDVPYQYSEKISAAVESKDVQIAYIKNGDHRLSTPENLELLKSQLLGIINS